MNKIQFKISLLMLLFIAPSACTVTAQPEYREIVELRNGNKTTYDNGVVKITATGIHRKREKAANRAKEIAILAVLFKGVPGSNLSSGIVSAKEHRQHQAFYDDFFKQWTNWENYVDVIEYDPSKIVRLPKKRHQAGLKINIDYKRLQKDLTDAGYLTKFGI